MRWLFPLCFLLLTSIGSESVAESRPPPSLPGDASHDGWVNEEDLALVQRDWMKGKVEFVEVDLPTIRFRPGARPLRFVSVPAGTFLMGTTESMFGSNSERPQHEVTLTRSFFMAQTEITQAQWLGVMGSYPSGFRPIGESVGNNYPIYYVTWDEAVSFAAQASSVTGKAIRLPTEAEWEYSCRGSSANPFRYSPFSFSDTLTLPLYTCVYDALYDRHMIYCANSGVGPNEVATRIPNDYGIYDMGGNMKEWCLDAYDESFYSSPGATEPDPIREAGLYDEQRSVRDSNWDSSAATLRSANRTGVVFNENFTSLGFRVVMEIGE